jgi:putative glycosyltransferase
VKVIELSRNFGHHAAIWCGLEHAKGELVFLIDSDLEVAPAILTEFNACLSRDPDVDVAYAYQEKRGGNLQTLAFGRLFWILFRHLSSVEIPPDVLTERLMRRTYVDALLRLGDRNLFLGGMMAWAGFRQVGVPTLKQTREGQASYSFARRLSLLVDAITSFSDLPMRYLFSFGSLISGVSFIVALLLILRKIINPEYVLQGFTFMAVLLLFTLGAMIGSIGLIGIYIGRIFVQTRARPIYIIKRIL